METPVQLNWHIMRCMCALSRVYRPVIALKQRGSQTNSLGDRAIDVVVE